MKAVTFFIAWQVMAASPSGSNKMGTFATAQEACESADRAGAGWIAGVTYTPDSAPSCCDAKYKSLRFAEQCKADPMAWDCVRPEYAVKYMECMPAKSFKAVGYK